MLLQVILSIERAFLTGGRVVVVDVFLARLNLATKDATDLACIWVDSLWSTRRAHPFLERHVKRLFVPLPIVLGSERLGTKGALILVPGKRK